MKLKKKLYVIAIVMSALLAGCARGDAKSAYTEASTQLVSGSYEEAEAGFKKVIESGYYLAYAYRGLGLTQMSTSNYAEACIAFERALLNVDGQGADFTKDVNLYLAFCRQRHGETDKTMEIYNSILARETDPDVLFLRGRLNMELGNEAAAASDFDKAATLSGDYDLYINIYQAYASHGKRADGSDYLERALKIVNTSQADYYNKGLVNYYLQNYDDAKSYLIQALDEDPEDSGSILLLGRVYLALNDVADARAMFNEYIDDPSTAPAAYNGLALCDMEDDDYEKALANVEKGLEYGNSTANRGLLFNEIIIYEHRRDWAMAKAKSAAYIAMYPADEAGLRENEFLSTR